MDKNIKLFAVALGFMVCGSTVTVAQDRMQDRNQDRQERMQGQDREELDYEDLFNGVENTEDHDVMELLKKDDNFSTFVELMERSGLDASVEFAEPVTIFAPTNDAFKNLSAQEYKDLTESDDQPMLQRIVKAHMLPEKVNMADFQTNQVIESANGTEIPVETRGDQGLVGEPTQVLIGGAMIKRPDVEASNGVIHVMEDVIIPGETAVTGFGKQ